MKARSWLFVPADSEKKRSRIGSTGADRYLLDLEDSVSIANKPGAREWAAAFLRESEVERERLWVRVNPVTGNEFERDLEAVMPAGPGGILLPKSRGPEDLQALAQRLDELEKRHGLPAGSTHIIALVTETPEALFTLGGYGACTHRLAGLSWGAEDLGSAIGASRWRDENGEWTPPFQVVRSLALFAAHAAGVPAIDTIYADFGDAEGLSDSLEQARRDGFSGKLAIHPAQVEAINRAFSPTQQEIERAKRIVELFNANPNAGVLEMDGQMLDRPHLLHAQRLLSSL